MIKTLGDEKLNSKGHLELVFWSCLMGLFAFFLFVALVLMGIFFSFFAP